MKASVRIELLAPVVIRANTSRANMALNNCIGALRMGDTPTCIASARRAAECAALAFLASKGIMNPRANWIPRYLLDQPGIEAKRISDRYAELLMMQVPKGDAQLFVDKTAEFISNVTLLAQSAL